MKPAPICADHGCPRAHYARGYCEAHFRRVLRRGTPDWDAPLRRTARRDAFDVERDVVAHLALDDAGCLVWPFARFPDGRGKVKTDVGNGSQVHVLVYVYVSGPVPEGLQVNHSCGRGHTGCADPRHLYAGTQRENLADARRHGSRIGRPPQP